MDAIPPMPPTPENSTPPAVRQWAVATHLSAFAGLALPFGNILAPLIIWLIKKPELPELDQIGRDVLNYQVSWTIWMIVATAVAVFGSCLIVPIAAPFVLGIAWIIFTVKGGMKASNGEPFVFPLTIKMF